MDEKLMILKMVEEGKLSVEEAARLLEAVDNKKAEGSLVVKENSSSAKFLRVRVLDTATNKLKVNVNVPIALVEIGLKLGMAYDSELSGQLENIDINEIIKAVKDGAEGKIVDVETDEGQKIEVMVE